MAKIFWLASYPKSGNTWVRALLTNYLRDKDRAAHINELEGWMAASRLWFDLWTGVEGSALPPHVVERLRPDVYRWWAREATETAFIKAHDAWRRTDRGEPLFPADVTAGVVYTVRNPLDIVASFAAHFGTDAAAAVDQLCDPEHVLSGSARARPGNLPEATRDWGGHVRSWLDESGLRIHLVRYEELAAEPEAVFARVVRFCRLPFDPERIAKAVRFSSFSELQRQELKGGFYERPSGATAPFFRRGRPGGWREELAPELVARLIDAQRDMMLRLGYLDDAESLGARS